METDTARHRIDNPGPAPEVGDALAMAELSSRTVATYCDVAAQFDDERSKELFEKAWLDALLELVPVGGRLLDVGCGAGVPIARYLIEQGMNLTGIDAAEPMLKIARARFPMANWLHCDMRFQLPPGKFHAIVAWNSFFHLSEADQPKVLEKFAKALLPGGRLLLTVGPAAGRAVGQVGGRWVYHASLSPEAYSSELASVGMKVLRFVPEDPSCRGHSVLLAERAE